MARPKTPPGLRFADVAPLWRLVETDGSATYTCNNESDAITKVYRLNRWRKEQREADPNGITQFDQYFVKRDGIRVIIVPRPTLDLDRITTLEGIPYKEAMRRADVTGTGTPRPQAEIDKLERELRAMHPDGLPWEKPDGLGLETSSDIRENIEQYKIDPETKKPIKP